MVKKIKIFERKDGVNVSNIIERGYFLKTKEIRSMLNDKNITREFLEERYYKRKNTLQQIALEFR